MNGKETLIKSIKSITPDIITSEEGLTVYSTDATNITNPDDRADIVVFPKTAAETAEIMKIAYVTETPVIARSAGTNLCGACLPKHGGIILDFSKMNSIVEINKNNLSCVVEPGVVIEDLQREAEKRGLFFPPDPSNLKVSMIGGCIGLSSGGPHTFKYGSVKDYVIDLEVVTSDGRIIHTGSKCAKDVTGYNITSLFVGSEGTLGVITKAVLKLVPKPEAKRVMLAYFDTLEDTAKTVNDIISNLITPSVIDLMDNNTLKTVENFCPSGLETDKTAALLIEIDGFETVLNEQYEKIKEICRQNRSSSIKTAETKEEEEKIWISRRASYGAMAKLAPDVMAEDMVVPRENIVEFVKQIRLLCDKYQIKTGIMGHIGDGNIHPNMALDLRNPVEAENFKKLKTELFELAVSLGGTISGEHGIGCEKSFFMEKAVDKGALEYMILIKKMFDPKNILNPGKIFDEKFLR